MMNKQEARLVKAVRNMSDKEIIRLVHQHLCEVLENRGEVEYGPEYKFFKKEDEGAHIGLTVPRDATVTISFGG